MFAVFLNDLRLLLRDRGAVLWLLLGPILFVSLISLARFDSGKRPPVFVPLVDDDQGPVAKAFTKLLGEHAEVYPTTREEAEALVRDRGRAAAAVVFPEGLSRSYLQGRSTSILLLTDPANGIGVNRVKVALLLTGRDAAELADPTAPRRVEVHETNLTGDRITRKSHEQSIPGFSLMFTLLAVVFGTASALHVEARSGIVQRFLVAPVGFSRILVARGASRMLVGSVQLLVLLGWGALVFGISLGSSGLALLAVVLATVFAAVGLAMLVAGLARSSEQVLPTTLAVVLPLAAIGGLWWPLHLEPPWMRALAKVTPSMWSMQGLTDLVLRDRGLAAALPTAGVLVLQGAVLLAVGVALFRRRFAARD